MVLASPLCSGTALSTLESGSLLQYVVLVDLAFMHADTMQTLEYLTKQLIDGYKSGDNLTQSFLNSYDFYIFPIVNPDGKYGLLRYTAAH